MYTNQFKTPYLFSFTLHRNPRSLEKDRSPGAGYSHTLPIRVCAAQRGRDFEAPDLGRGIHFRGERTKAPLLCKQPFEIIQGQIAFKNTVQRVNKQTVVLLLHPRTEYKKLAHF